MSALYDAWMWIVAVAVFMVPTTYFTIWPATILSPARVGILFMAEIIVGVGTAAMMTVEPFGLREASGTLLIICAGIVEVRLAAGREGAG